MFARLNQLARHFSRSLPNYLHTSAAAAAATAATSPPSLRAAMAHERNIKPIHTAACLVIGDEVLGGKTVDTNSAYVAKFCFSLGIALARIEVIPDARADIIEAVRRMSHAYDFVVTSGGIGPTHDDITYSSIAAAFDLPLVVHEKTLERMKRLSRPHPSQQSFSWDEDTPAREAKMRMVRLPYDAGLSDEEQVVFVSDDLWVPVSVVNGNVHILPGIPRLFEKMLEGLKPRILPRLAGKGDVGIHRLLFSTPLAESEVAGFLTELAQRVEGRGVKVGSYPRWGKSRNTVTLVGRDKEFLEELVPEVEAGVKGRRVQVEGEDDSEGSDKDA